MFRQIFFHGSPSFNKVFEASRKNAPIQLTSYNWANQQFYCTLSWLRSHCLDLRLCRVRRPDPTRPETVIFKMRDTA
jgi:hypothetical protein